MKKISLYSSMFVLAVVASPSAQAATVLQHIQADIARGNFTEVQSLISHNPNAASAAVADLVSAAQKDMAGNPQVSAQALQLAASYAKDINGDVAVQIAHTVQDIVKANRANTTYCMASSLRDGVCHTISAAAAAIASSPAIVTVDPQLYAEATAPDAQKRGATGNPETLQLAQSPNPAAPSAPFQQPKHWPQPSAQSVQQVQAAVSGNHFEVVGTLIKSDPAVTSTAVVALVATAQKNLGTNPPLALQALQLAATHSKEVSPTVAPQVTATVQAIEQANKEKSDCDDVCQAITVAAAEFLSDVQVAFQDPEDVQLAQQPTAPIAHFQQPLQIWLTPPNPPSIHTLASGF